MKRKTSFLCVAAAVLILSAGATAGAYDVQVDNDTTDVTLQGVFVSACTSPGDSCQNTGGVTILPGGSNTFSTGGSRCPYFIMYHIVPPGSSMSPSTAHCQCITPTSPTNATYPAGCGTSCASSHWGLKRVNGELQIQPK
jgi:hypothetical protein